MPTAEIIAIGTELLLGETLDTNTQFIAHALRELGVNVFRTSIIGDNKDRIVTIVREAMGRTEIIITTGGLGPTVDDPTRAALALASNYKLVFHPELWESISTRIRKIGRNASENQKRQAFIPENAFIIENPVGTAPAFIVISKMNVIVSLPGVPAEMKTLLARSVIPFLQNHYDIHDTIMLRIIHTSGVGEGWIDEKIGDLEILSNPTVGLAAHSGVVDIRIVVKASNSLEAKKRISELEAEISKRLGDHIFGFDSDTLENKALEAVENCGWTLSSLEAGTQGLLNQRLSDLKNPSYLEGNLVDQAKKSLLTSVKEFKSKGKADVILGLSVSLENNLNLIDQVVITPINEFDHQLIYTGSPQDSPELGVNLILDRLRRMANDSNKPVF